MAIARVTVGYDAKVSKNYNSQAASVSLEMVLPSDSTFEQAEAAAISLFARCKALVREQLTQEG